MSDDPVFRYVADLVDRPRPKVCLVPTAASAVPISVMRFLSVFPADRFEPTYLDLFDRDDRDLRRLRLLAGPDLRGRRQYGEPARDVAGPRARRRSCRRRGSRASCWPARSAGANCWFEASTTDSFGPLAPLPDGLGPAGGQLLSALRGRARPTSALPRRWSADGFPPGIACDDRAAVHYVGNGARGRRGIGSRPSGRVPGLHRATTGSGRGVASRPDCSCPIDRAHPARPFGVAG